MAFNGKWVFDKSENLDGLMDVLNVPAENRAKLASGKPTYEFTKVADGEGIMKLIGPNKTIEVHMKKSEEYDSPAGVLTDNTRKVRAEKVSGTKFTIRGTGDQSQAINRMVETREVLGDQMVVTIQIDDAVCKRYFKRA
ncbi:fatty acid-binding protein-like [Glandiceps talaboti]